MYRHVLLAAVIAFTPVLAMADESISGQWQTNRDHNVLIEMDVLADNFWTSQTIQGNKVVAQMAGSYDQQKTSSTTGTLVFTPTKSKTTAQHGAATVETDKYTLEHGGKTLRLVSEKNDVMVFHKRPYAK